MQLFNLEKLKYSYFATVVIVGWALTPPIGEFLIAVNKELHPLQLSFLRYLLAFLGLLTILLIKNRKAIVSTVRALKKKWKYYIFTAMTSALMPVFLFFAVRWTSASAASFLLNANIVYIPLFAFLLMRDRVKKIQMVGIFVTLVGLFILIFEKELISHNFTLSELSIIGNILALLSGVAWGLYTVSLKKFFGDEDPMAVTALNLFFGAILLFIAVAVFEGFHTNLSLLGGGLVVVIAVVSTSLAYTYWLELLGVLSATKTGILQAFVPVLSTIIAVIWLKETMSYLFFIGTPLIILGTLLVETVPTDKNKRV